jgi:hypothetical protein
MKRVVPNQHFRNNSRGDKILPEIQDGKEYDPDPIHEMPIEADIIQQMMVSLG